MTTKRKPIPHGTLNGYSNYRCRCDNCKKIWSEYCYSLRQRRIAQRIKIDDKFIMPGIQHGKPNGYSNYRCECAPCRAAHATERKRYLAKREKTTRKKVQKSIKIESTFPAEPNSVRVLTITTSGEILADQTVSVNTTVVNIVPDDVDYHDTEIWSI